MDSFLTYLDMEGAGIYIWPAYGLAFLLLGLLCFFSRRKMYSSEKEMNALLAERTPSAPSRLPQHTGDKKEIL